MAQHFFHQKHSSHNPTPRPPRSKRKSSLTNSTQAHREAICRKLLAAHVTGEGNDDDTSMGRKLDLATILLERVSKPKSQMHTKDNTNQTKESEARAEASEAAIAEANTLTMQVGVPE